MYLHSKENTSFLVEQKFHVPTILSKELPTKDGILFYSHSQALTRYKTVQLYFINWIGFQPRFLINRSEWRMKWVITLFCFTSRVTWNLRHCIRKDCESRHRMLSTRSAGRKCEWNYEAYEYPSWGKRMVCAWVWQPHHHALLWGHAVA
jgi:hypothetical protein